MAAQYSFVMKGLTKTFPGAPKPILSQHPPAILSRRQDRHRRPERLGQVDADEDHGRPRHRVRRRGLAGRGDQGRLSRAGAAARSDQDGQGECDGRGPADRRPGRAVQRDLRRRWPIRDADFDALRHRDGRVAGEDRRGRRLDARQPARDRDGRAALPARRRRGRQSVRRREAPRRADPAAAREARHPAARRADQPSRRRERAMAGEASRRLSGQRHPGHPRPLFPRQCGELGAGARSRPLLRLRIQLFRLFGEES